MSGDELVEQIREAIVRGGGDNQQADNLAVEVYTFGAMAENTRQRLVMHGVDRDKARRIVRDTAAGSGA